MVDFSKYLKRTTHNMQRTITNRFGLPQSLYRAICNDPYVGGGDISITRLIAPPRIVALRKKHEAEIVEDASDRIWSLLGQAAHAVAERGAQGVEGAIAEKRLSMRLDGIMKPDGILWNWELTGQHDILEQGVLSDYKVTSVWSFMFGDKPEWDQQLNLQAMVHRHAGEQINQIQIIAILRDWQKRKAEFEKDYPPVAVHVVRFPLWTFDEQVDFAQQRVRLHQTAQKDFKLSDYNPDSLPLCTPEERWYRGSAFLVKRMQIKSEKVNKKSDRRASSLEEAEKFIAQNAPPKGTAYLPIQEVPGMNIRCMDYCDVAAFCPFGRKLREERLQARTNQHHEEDQEETLL